MSLPRLVLVSRRYWPLVGGAERVMARLAQALAQRGCRVTLLTARWRPEWPEQIDQQGVSVVRLPQPEVRFYGTWRYMRAIAAWLAAHRDRYDLVYVSMLKHDAYAAIGTGSRLKFPVVLRAEGPGLSGDCHWQLENRFGAAIKRRCLAAAALVAPSPEIERELIAAGYSRQRIHVIANGVPLAAERTSESRRAARAALAGANPALRLTPGAAVAVYTGRLHPRKGLANLVRAWSRVSSALPGARLWLVGDGEDREPLLRLIDEFGLAGQVILAGAYDEVDDFLAAADLFVLPSLEEGLSVAMLEAMSAALPVVASDIPGNRALVGPSGCARLVPPDEPEPLAKAMIDILQGTQEADRLGRLGRQQVATGYTLDRAVDGHLALFARILEGDFADAGSLRPRPTSSPNS